MASSVPVLLTDSAGEDPRLKALQVLRAKLLTIKAECALLERELIAERVSVLPIEAIPPEIFSIIFKYYLIENPRLIRRLMLVCRRWYRIAIHDPTLWSRIAIEVGHGEKDLKGKAESMARFIEACVKHSGDMLLDINIHCRGLRTWPEEVDATLKSAFKRLYPEAQTLTVENWLWSQHISHMENEDLPLHYSHVMRLLSKFGKGDSRYRWGSLTLVIPEAHELVEHVLARLPVASPNITRLSIRGKLPERRKFLPSWAVFRDLTSLESLEVTDLQLLKLFQQPFRLQELHVYEGLNEQSLPIFNSFKDLRTLKLSPPWSSVSFAAPPSYVLTLPKLEVLHLNGPYLFKLPNFNLPALQQLHLPDHRAGFFDSLPVTRASHIYWSILSHEEETYKVEAKKTAERILIQYYLARHMTVPANCKIAVLEAIAEMRHGGMFRSALEFVIFENPPGQVEETIAVDSI